MSFRKLLPIYIYVSLVFLFKILISMLCQMNSSILRKTNCECQHHPFNKPCKSVSKHYDMPTFVCIIDVKDTASNDLSHLLLQPFTRLDYTHRCPMSYILVTSGLILFAPPTPGKSNILCVGMSEKM